MNKINLISDVIKISLEFDELLLNGKFNELKNKSDEFNFKLNKLKEYNMAQFDNDILSIINDINKINIYAIGSVAKNHNSYNSHDNSIKTNSMKSNRKENNTLILFYTNRCKYSIMFFPEWKKLKTHLNGKINTIALNCENEKYTKICKYFNIYEYPTIKYVTPTKIHDYHGNMTCNEINDTFLLF